MAADPDRQRSRSLYDVGGFSASVEESSYFFEKK
jgi:hypothetical protein